MNASSGREKPALGLARIACKTVRCAMAATADMAFPANEEPITCGAIDPSNSRVRHTLLQANRKFDFNPCSGTNWHCAEEDGWGRAASVAPVLP